MQHPQAKNKVLVLITDISLKKEISELLIADVDELKFITVNDSTPEYIQKYHPNVVIFALDSFAKSLNLMKTVCHEKPLACDIEAIALCHRKEVRQAYTACLKGWFRFYLIFMPLYDKFQFKLAVKNALDTSLFRHKVALIQRKQHENRS